MAKKHIQRLRQRAAEKQGWICFWCHEEMRPSTKFYWGSLDQDICTADHIIPQALDGPTSENNIVAACNKCNLKRGKKEEFEKWRRRSPAEREFHAEYLRKTWHRTSTEPQTDDHTYDTVVGNALLHAGMNPELLPHTGIHIQNKTAST